MEPLMYALGLLLIAVSYIAGLRDGWRSGWKTGADLGIKAAVWFAGRAQQRTPGQPIDWDRVRKDSQELFKV